MFVDFCLFFCLIPPFSRRICYTAHAICFRIRFCFRLNPRLLRRRCYSHLCRLLWSPHAPGVPRHYRYPPLLMLIRCHYLAASAIAVLSLVLGPLRLSAAVSDIATATPSSRHQACCVFPAAATSQLHRFIVGCFFLVEIVALPLP